MINGLIQPDRKPNPHLLEAKKVYQNFIVRTIGLEDFLVEIVNENFFINSDEYHITWELKSDGKILQHGKLEDLHIEPQTSMYVNIPVAPFTMVPLSEYFLEFEFRAKKTKGLIEKNHLVAWEQLPLVNYGTLKNTMEETSLSQLEFVSDFKSVFEDEESIVITGDKFKIKFSKVKGTLDSWKLGQKDYILTGPKPNFWRPPTDNDFGNNMPLRLSVWKEASKNQKIEDVQVTKRDNFIGVNVTIHYPDLDAKGETAYGIYGDGTVLVTNSLNLEGFKLPNLPKFGMNMVIPRQYDNFKWFGRGPHESYSDRKASTKIDVFSGKVTDQYHPYVRPQENGNKTDVRWATLRDDNGYGLMLTGFLSLKASHFTNDDYDSGILIDDAGKPKQHKKSMHTTDMNEKNLIHIDIDQLQMGVGGEDSWGAQPLEEYQLTPKKYIYHFSMRIIEPSDEPISIYKNRF